MEYSAKEISNLINGRIEGDSNVKISKVSKIEDASEGSLCFVSNPKYTHYIYETKASVVLVPETFTPEKSIENTTLIYVKDTYLAFAMLLKAYNDELNPPKQGISSKAVIHETAKIGKDVYIGENTVISSKVVIGDNVQIYPNSYVGDNSIIDDNSVIYPNVTLYFNTKIGKNCTIHAGVVIGADGFGFAPQSQSEYTKISQIGDVIIEDNVEIGANTTIDRATMGSTIIRKGVKLDNLIQVAHNVEIGENTVIAAQTGIAGSTKLGKNMMIGGQVGFAGHMEVADDVKIGAQSGLGTNVKNKGSIMIGSPAMDASKYRRAIAIFNNIEKLYNRVNELEKQLKEIKK